MEIFKKRLFNRIKNQINEYIEDIVNNKNIHKIEKPITIIIAYSNKKDKQLKTITSQNNNYEEITGVFLVLTEKDKKILSKNVIYSELPSEEILEKNPNEYFKKFEESANANLSSGIPNKFSINQYNFFEKIFYPKLEFEIVYELPSILLKGKKKIDVEELIKPFFK